MPILDTPPRPCSRPARSRARPRRRAAAGLPATAGLARARRRRPAVVGRPRRRPVDDDLVAEEAPVAIGRLSAATRPRAPRPPRTCISSWRAVLAGQQHLGTPHGHDTAAAAYAVRQPPGDAWRSCRRLDGGAGADQGASGRHRRTSRTAGRSRTPIQQAWLVSGHRPTLAVASGSFCPREAPNAAARSPAVLRRRGRTDPHLLLSWEVRVSVLWVRRPSLRDGGGETCLPENS